MRRRWEDNIRMGLKEIGIKAGNWVDWKNLYILLLWGEGRTHSYEIFSKTIFYIRNRAVKWFGRDDISFASGR